MIDLITCDRLRARLSPQACAQRYAQFGELPAPHPSSAPCHGCQDGRERCAAAGLEARTRGQRWGVAITPARPLERGAR